MATATISAMEVIGASGELTSAAIELLTSTDAREIRSRLVLLGLVQGGADRCTLTSIDRGVFRVEDSVEREATPTFVGREYPWSYLESQPLVKEAVRTGRVVTGGGFTRSGETAPDLTRSLDDIKHTAIVPLKLGTEVGALLVLSRRDDPGFSARDLDHLREMGGMAVLSLRNARLLEDVTAAQRRGLDALTLISDHVAASEILPAFFGRMSTSVAGLAGARRVAYWIVDGDHLVAQPETYGFTADEQASMRTSLRAAVEHGIGDVLYGGAALRDDAGADATKRAPIAPDGVFNLLAVPWRTSEGPLGLLVAYDSVAGFAAQDEWIMRLAARGSALVWQSYTAQRRVTELQTAELERLKDHAARMAAVERQKSDFLKLASHELRGPIAILRGYLSMMRDGTMGALPANLLSTAELMERQAVQMKDLVDQMLNAARLESGSLPIEVYDTRIDEVVRKVVDGVSNAASRSRIVLTDVRPVHAMADRKHVETIVGNLLSNALKYSPDGGEVMLSLREHDDVVELDVADRGVGIPPEELARLFQPFTRLGEADSRGIEGVGLGLYLSRELARVQDGDIIVRSKPGEGSVFTLRLPARRDAG
ncbi:MAG: ATP-binding protein [Candidatus Dormibacteria bacterium]